MNFTDLLGKEFKIGGRGPDAFDCYGLAIEIRSRAGLPFPGNYTSTLDRQAIHDQIAHGSETYFIQIPGPRPFCVVTFKLVGPFTSHLGVVLPDLFRFVHILPKLRTAVERLDSVSWRRRTSGFWEMKP